jgi:SpoVK/Ycf46/Vps4 family AAA+-type ATPase
MTGSDIAGLLRRAYLDRASQIAKWVRYLAHKAGMSVAEFQRYVIDQQPEGQFACTDDHEWRVVKGDLEECWRCRCRFRISEDEFKKLDFEIVIGVDSVAAALKVVTPSVSEEELRRYEQLRDEHATVIG